MFTTLKILAAIGGLTFLGGNSLLSNIAARRWAGDEPVFLKTTPPLPCVNKKNRIGKEH